MDHVEGDLYLVDEDVERESESDESESDNKNGEVEVENEKTQFIIGNETAQPEITIPSLMNACTAPLINKDAKFLDALKDVFESNEQVIFSNCISKR